MTVYQGVVPSPFFAHESMRTSQQEMVADGIEALSERGSLLAAAPTGIGKTAAALASALEVANSVHDFLYKPKILFMTGRQSQHKIVVETVRQINSNLPRETPRVKLVDIIGREGMCESVDKSTGKCSCEEGIVEESRKGRRSDLRDKILEEPRHVGWSVKFSRQRKICAWATARSAVKYADILVCDYNHVFIEGIRESSLPAMGVELGDSILIVDEAHNLPDRIRKGLERRITYKVFRRALSDVQEYRGGLEKTVKQLDIESVHGLSDAIMLEKQIKALSADVSLRSWFDGKHTEIEAANRDDLRIETGEFLDIVAGVLQGIGEDGDPEGESLIRRMNSALLSVKIEEDESLDEDEENDCIRLAEMLQICIGYRNSPALALVFDRIGDENRITSHLLDPGVIGRPIFEKSAGSILMSGTLFPPDMYSDILGIPNGNTTCKEYESGFPPENRPVLIASDVTSKYTEREASYGSIRSHIQSVLEKTNGNVAVFAPSYAMLDRIREGIYTFGKVDKVEGRRMSKNEVERVIASLYEMRAMGRETVLFGVLRGKLSEGIDYSGNILNAVVCVGLPFPPPSARQDLTLIHI